MKDRQVQKDEGQTSDEEEKDEEQIDEEEAPCKPSHRKKPLLLSMYSHLCAQLVLLQFISIH
ncbi:LOW QUALITY PROTEIN: hypothetical protein V1478_016951 [Vespula squamosa]|uniref:Uncharacterized protein n=1 Tax=Vespula squamosa TaxID=30214 RepID=A0ABD1ZY13_VESSQ